MRVKIFGAGSIGNHLAHAAKQLGWSVDICDVDRNALERTRVSIYPSRYGLWDPSIGLFHVSEAPVGNYDLIIIGTPPDTHINLLLQALSEDPKAILVEKPLCGPGLCGVEEIITKAVDKSFPIFIGYDHIVGRSCQFASKMVQNVATSNPKTLDVEFREHWGGIFQAHPWLTGPQDSYLGFYERGGGALGEHSHALNMWQYFAKLLGCGRVHTVSASLSYVKNEFVDYDEICCLNLTTENGMLGRCIQDVLTTPPRKMARIQYIDGFIEWHCNFHSGVDRVIEWGDKKKPNVHDFAKTRPDDFIQELLHVSSHINCPELSPLNLKHGLETSLVIAAAHLSHSQKSTVNIDYTKGLTLAALSI